MTLQPGTQKGYVLIPLTGYRSLNGSTITSQVRILRADDEIEHFEFEGRTFAGDSEHEVFIHHLYQELPDEWLPADQICIRMSDPEYDARFAAEIAEQGLTERDHMDCTISDELPEEASEQQVPACPECASEDTVLNKLPDNVDKPFECNRCGHAWS